MLADVNPLVRLRGVEILEQDLLQKNAKADVATKILSPFLKDNDERVQSNAAKVFYKYDRTAAVAVLKTMFLDADEDKQLAAAWVFGVVADPEGVQAMVKGLNTYTQKVRMRCLLALQKIDKENPEALPKELRSQVRSILSLKGMA